MSAGPAPEYEGLKWMAGQWQRVGDRLAAEEALQIRINGTPFTVIMRTPGDEKDLVRGLLYTEDLYNGQKMLNLGSVEYNELGYINSVDVCIPEEELGDSYVNSRTLLSVSSCGICGKRELDDLSVKGERLKSKNPVDAAIIPELFEKMRKNQVIFGRTGGCHAAALFDAQGHLLAIREDIGRHNAVDKAIGALLPAGSGKRAQFLLVSGRISYEIVTKAFRAGVPVLAAVSSPSSLAVDFAKELGITLIAFSRENRFTCYAWPERLKINREQISK